jgi:hypothetical protein
MNINLTNGVGYGNIQEMKPNEDIKPQSGGGVIVKPPPEQQASRVTISPEAQSLLKNEVAPRSGGGVIVTKPPK